MLFSASIHAGSNTSSRGPSPSITVNQSGCDCGSWWRATPASAHHCWHSSRNVSIVAPRSIASENVTSWVKSRRRSWAANATVRRRPSNASAATPVRGSLTISAVTMVSSWRRISPCAVSSRRSRLDEITGVSFTQYPP